MNLRHAHDLIEGTCGKWVAGLIVRMVCAVIPLYLADVALRLVSGSPLHAVLRSLFGLVDVTEVAGSVVNGLVRYSLGILLALGVIVFANALAAYVKRKIMTGQGTNG